MHQPLHAITRVSQSQPQGDDGGNQVHLCAPPCRDVLHLLWDGVLGGDRDPIGLRVDAMLLRVPTGPETLNLDPARWAAESFTLAQSQVYRQPIGPGAGPFALTEGYVQNAQRVAMERVALAAARLANILKMDLR